MKKLTYVLSLVLLFLSFGVITQGRYQSWKVIRSRKQKSFE
ncbi:hypothetical protein ACR0S4_28685 [Priestia megaterium]